MKELFAAFSRAQAKVKHATKDSNNPHFRSKYADLAEVWDTIREPFTSEGLAIIQFPCEADAGRVGVRTIVAHSSGEFLEEKFTIGCKDASNPQAAGSAYTYARRYSLMAVCGIAADDDDGNAAAAVAFGPAKAQSKPGVVLPRGGLLPSGMGYEEAIMLRAADASDVEARNIYAEVRQSNHEAKDRLLLKISELIRSRQTATATASKKEGQ